MADADPDLRNTFAEDAATRLDRMADQLLELESSPAAADVLAAVMRDAHSLKGAAAVIGLQQVADVAHALEGPLQRMRSGQLAPTHELTDDLLGAIDVLRNLVAAASSGDDGTRHSSVVQAIGNRLAAYNGSDLAAAATVTSARATPDEGRGATQKIAANGHTTTMQVAVQRLDQIDRLVGESAAAHLRVGQLLADRLATDPAMVTEYRDLARLLSRLQEVTMQARMVPLSMVTPSLHRAVRDVARAGGKDVRWEVEGADTEIDRNVLEKLRDPLLHLVRNAVDHGIESPQERKAAGKQPQGTVRLKAAQQGSEIVITITDDGAGINVPRVREKAISLGIEVEALAEAQVIDLIFRQGMSTARKVTEISGRGVGLDVVRTNLNLVRGRVQVENAPHQGAVFTIAVPITLTIVQCLVIESAGHRFALPVHSIASLMPAETDELQADGRRMVLHGSQAVPMNSLATTLAVGDAGSGPVVVVTAAGREHAFRVGGLVGQRDFVVKGLGRLLPRLECVAGAAVEPDGNVIVVLDAAGLLDRARRQEGSPQPAAEPVSHQPSILIADDALTVRELERSILERAGYRVRVASDGGEAFGLLQQEPADLVLTDLEMPALDGLALTEMIRRHPRLSKTPVVILTSHDSEEDRQRGLAAGASEYIIKAGFDQQRLLSLVEQLLLGGHA